MTAQRTFADATLSNCRRTTRIEQFLSAMDQVTEWSTIEALVELYYPKTGRGPLPMPTMLRRFLLQKWVSPSDPQPADMLDDSKSMRRFSRIDLVHDTVPTRRPSAGSATCWRRISSPRPRSRS